jgi:two-component system, NarL family, invasion response regulator UvrY
MARILIADDHPIVRRGLKQILAEEPDFSQVGEAQSAREVHQQIRESRWDILILDINLPDQSGLEVLREVREQKPNLPVLILSMHPEDQFATRVLKSGASGYLTKDSAPDELIKAVRKILSGGRYISASLAEQLAASLSGASPESPHQTLTDREFQVLCLIASGKTVSEIAAHLDLSVKTISTYRTRLLEKMNLKTNAELTSYAVRHGLVE